MKSEIKIITVVLLILVFLFGFVVGSDTSKVKDIDKEQYIETITKMYIEYQKCVDLLDESHRLLNESHRIARDYQAFNRYEICGE